jgi:hypothetical protein
MGELPNSHGRTLTDKSYVMHGILSGTYLRAVPTFCEWKKLHLNQRPAFPVFLVESRGRQKALELSALKTLPFYFADMAGRLVISDN